MAVYRTACNVFDHGYQADKESKRLISDAWMADVYDQPSHPLRPEYEQYASSLCRSPPKLTGLIT